MTAARKRRPEQGADEADKKNPPSHPVTQTGSNRADQ